MNDNSDHGAECDCAELYVRSERPSPEGDLVQTLACKQCGSFKGSATRSLGPRESVVPVSGDYYSRSLATVPSAYLEFLSGLPVNRVFLSRVAKVLKGESSRVTSIGEIVADALRHIERRPGHHSGA